MDACEKSFDAAADVSKLLITLATGGVAAGLALMNVESGKATALSPVSWLHKSAIAAALIALLISAGMGIWTQLAITHVLSESRSGTSPDVWSAKITVPFQLQISTFLIGIAAFVGYGLIRLAA